MLFLRQIQHLLPRAEAWRIETQKRLRELFVGLAAGAAEPARQYVDDACDDLWPETTREIEEWERQHGIAWPSTVTAERIAALRAEWASTGGQSADYIQGILQAAGFPIFVHHPWLTTSPYVARDPNDWLTTALVGTTQCDEPLAQCGEPEAVCGTTEVQAPDYFANRDLTSRGQPPLPTDPAKYPFFMYVGGETFGDVVQISVARKREFEHLVLKLRPLHNWVGLFIDYVDPILTEDDDPILTEDDQPLYA